MKAMKDCGKGINAMSQEKSVSMDVASRMSNKMKDLDRQTTNLYDVTYELCNRLAPALLPIADDAENSQKWQEEGMAPLEQEIHTITVRLSGITSMLQDALDRLVL